jgi:hypothetical protein
LRFIGNDKVNSLQLRYYKKRNNENNEKRNYQERSCIYEQLFGRESKRKAQIGTKSGYGWHGTQALRNQC